MCESVSGLPLNHALCNADVYLAVPLLLAFAALGSYVYFTNVAYRVHRKPSSGIPVYYGAP